MNLNKPFFIIKAWLFLYGITFTGYALSELTGTPSEVITTPSGIDDKLFLDWINLLYGRSPHAYLLRGGICDEGCRDFKVTCSRPVEISKADQLNGITEAKIIGMTYIYYNGREYGDGASVAHFRKRSGVWTLYDNKNAFVNVIKCSFSPFS